MARFQAVSLLAALLCALMCARQCQACTQIIMGGPRAAFPAAYPDQVLSARNMGFFMPENLGFDLVAVPKGTRLAQMPVNGTTPLYGPAPVKHAFVCVGARTKQLGAAIATHTNDPAAASAYAGICADGLNTAGLSAAWLWDSGNALSSVLPSPGAADADAEITYPDLTARILGQCDTVECARAEVSRLAAVNTPFMRAIAASVIGHGYDFVAVHGTFCDKSGRCIAVEWPEAGAAAIYDLPQGVFTNEPGVPAHVALYGSYLASSRRAYGAAGPAAPLFNWPGGAMQYRPANLSVGAAEPVARYVRMAMMMQLYGPVAYPNPENRLSPGHYGSKLAALSQISSIINYAAETGAAPDNLGDYQWAGQMSHFISTRDHVAGDFYLRTAWNQNQHRFNVARVASGAAIKVADLTTLMPATAYAQDTSF